MENAITEKYYLVIVSEEKRQADIKNLLVSHGIDAPVQTICTFQNTNLAKYLTANCLAVLVPVVLH